MFVGAKVRDVEDGDVGVVTNQFQGKYPRCWWVLWETGDFAGQELWLHEQLLELVEE